MTRLRKARPAPPVSPRASIPCCRSPCSTGWPPARTASSDTSENDGEPGPQGPVPFSESRFGPVIFREDPMAFELPPLPYPKDGLEPYMSSRTLEFHHGKHHQTYVTTLNELVKDTPFAGQSLEDVI